MQNLIEFVQGTVRRIAFAYRKASLIAFVSRRSSKVERECFIGETTSLRKVCNMKMGRNALYIHITLRIRTRVQI